MIAALFWLACTVATATIVLLADSPALALFVCVTTVATLSLGALTRTLGLANGNDWEQPF